MRIEPHGLGVDRNLRGIAREIGQVAAVQAYGHERGGLWRIRGGDTSAQARLRRALASHFPPLKLCAGGEGLQATLSSEPLADRRVSMTATRRSARGSELRVACRP